MVKTGTVESSLGVNGNHGRQAFRWYIAAVVQGGPCGIASRIRLSRLWGQVLSVTGVSGVATVSSGRFTGQLLVL